MRPTTLIALLSALSTPTLAASVFAIFRDEQKNIVSKTHFEVSNPGCFTVHDAKKVEFTQAGGGLSFCGPYCLYSYEDSEDAKCEKELHHQEFSGSQRHAIYDLTEHTRNYRWALGRCQ